MQAVVSADDPNYSEAAEAGLDDAGQTIKDDAKGTLDNARAAYDKMAQVKFEETVPKPEDVQSAAKECVKGIMDADFGFGLNVPSASNLLNSACKKINSKVKDYLRKKSEIYSKEYFDDLIGAEMGVGFGGASDGTLDGIDYDKRGREISDEVWNEIQEDYEWLE